MSSVLVFDIKRFAVHDGPGIRTTVFFKGCPLNCWWCHNPESRKSFTEEVIYQRRLGKKEVECKKVYGKFMSVDEVMTEVLKDQVFHEESLGGVTFSGGEPLFQPTALFELLQRSKEKELHTAVDTCGHADWKHLEKILPFTDLFLYDLKLIDSENHEKFTGVSTDLITENLKKLIDHKANIELRIPVIPTINNSREEVVRFIQFLEKKVKYIPKVHLLPYHKIANGKYKKLGIQNMMSGMEEKDGLDINEFKYELETAGFNVGIGG